MVTACWASRSSGRSTGRRASISPASSAARAAATSTSSSALVGTQVSRLTAPGRWPLRPARWMSRPTALGAADLQHPVHRGEVHAEVERRGAHHAAQLALAEPVLHPLAGGPIHRAVVQRDDAGPVRTRGQQGLEPDLRGGAGVGEDQSGLALLDRPDHLRQKAQSDLSRPGKALHRLRDQRIHLERLGDQTLEDPSGPRCAILRHTKKRVTRGLEVAERGGEAEGAETGPEAAEPRQAELGLSPPLRRHQLVPLVDHNEREVLEERGGVVAGQQERKALGGGDQRARKALALAGPDASWRVAGAGLDAPGDAQVFDRGAKRGFGVARECAERRDPEDGEWRGRAAGRGGIVAQPLHQRSHPGRVRLARAGGGVDQPALAGEVRLPHPLLERERLPLVQREPLAHAVDRLAIGALDHAGRTPPGLRRGDGAGGRAFGGLFDLAPRGSGTPQVNGERGAAASAATLRHRVLSRAGSAGPSSGPPARRPRARSCRSSRRRSARTRTGRVRPRSG